LWGHGNTGDNLISFPLSISKPVGEAIPDNFENLITVIVTEGAAATQITPGIWVGSMHTFTGGKGYWVIVTASIQFSFVIE
jgi:hypothetical protein